MCSPPINLPGWQITVGIFLSLTLIIIIEKIYGIHVNIRKGDTMATLPGWAHILGPGETEAALLHRWIDAHRTLHQPQPTASTPAPAPAPAPQMSSNTAQQSGYISSLKSKQLMADA